MGEKQSERHARDLAEIKAREQVVKDAIRRGEPSVDTMSFGMSQLQLRSVVADEQGRLWRVDGPKLTLLSGPRRELR